MFILGFCLALTPWTIRNYKLHGVFMPVASYGGYILYGSNHPTDGKIFGFMIPSDPVMEEYETIKSEVERNRFMMRQGIKTIMDEPMRVLKLSRIKFLTFIVPFDWEIISRTGKARYNITYAIVFPFFILGLLILLFRTKVEKFEHFVLISIFAYFLFFAVFLYGSPRFRLPIEPLMIIYGAFAYCKLKEKMRRPYLLHMALLLFSGFNIHIYFHSEVYKTAVAGFLHTVGIW